MIVIIIVNVDGITVKIDVLTELVSLDGSLDDYNDGLLEGLLLGDSLVSTDGKALGSDEGTKTIFTDGKVLFNILGNVYGITLGFDVLT